MSVSLWLDEFEPLFRKLEPEWFGTVRGIDGARLRINGLSGIARIGDRFVIERTGAGPLAAEAIGFDGDSVLAYAFSSAVGVASGDRALLDRHSALAHPSEDWIGEVLDWRGLRHDGGAPRRGRERIPLDRPPPSAPIRKRIGERMATGHALFDTFLPLCRGQRIGLFAGSGVGKSMLLGSLAQRIEADICVIALIGERGREVRAFVEDILGPDGLARSVVIASTSDESALAKKQGAKLALAAAEYFRAQGNNTLLVLDSLTRYAEAHREIALAAGEPPSLHAFPPSTFNAIAALVERAGPGLPGEGDITAIFSVLVAGSDMEEPVADIVRGVLDGHVVLDRLIAERGRFPAVNVRKSVSRSLPGAASKSENALLADARAMLSTYEESELIIRSGLYTPGSDPRIDRAIRLFPALDSFFTKVGEESCVERFAELSEILDERRTSKSNNASDLHIRTL